MVCRKVENVPSGMAGVWVSWSRGKRKGATRGAEMATSSASTDRTSPFAVPYWYCPFHVLPWSFRGARFITIRTIRCDEGCHGLGLPTSPESKGDDYDGATILCCKARCDIVDFPLQNGGLDEKIFKLALKTKVLAQISELTHVLHGNIVILCAGQTQGRGFRRVGTR